MAPELRYLAYTAILTGCRWIPVVIGYGVSRGPLRPIDHKVAPTKTLPDWVNRANRAHVNAVEAFAPFAAIVLTAHAVGVSTACSRTAQHARNKRCARSIPLTLRRRGRFENARRSGPVLDLTKKAAPALGTRNAGWERARRRVLAFAFTWARILAAAALNCSSGQHRKPLLVLHLTRKEAIHSSACRADCLRGAHVRRAHTCRGDANRADVRRGHADGGDADRGHSDSGGCDCRSRIGRADRGCVCGRSLG
jgi:MAPEG family